jgi:hypothetical protein
VSQERAVIDAATGAEITVAAALEMDPEEHKRLRTDKKAKYARVLDRGMTNARLHVDLPDHLHGEWVPNDKMAIFEKQAIGFFVDTEYGNKMPFHDERSGQGDGRSVIGDVVFMTCSKEDKQILDEIRAEDFERANGNPNAPESSQLEERNFSANNQKLGMPVVEESRHRTARKAELEAALQRTVAEAGQKPAQPQPKGRIIR